MPQRPSRVIRSSELRAARGKSRLSLRGELDDQRSELAKVAEEARRKQAFYDAVTFYRQVNIAGGNILFVDNGSGWSAVLPGNVTVKASSDTAYLLATFRNAAGSGVGTISQNGTNTAYNTTSDERLKEDVEPVLDSGEIIDQLDPVYFTWKANGKRDFGFIAQQVAAIPQVGGSVFRGNDKAVDDPDFLAWSMQRGALEPVVVAEIKSLRGRLAAVEARAGD